MKGKAQSLTQPNVPFYFAALIVVMGSMIGFALAFTDPSVTFLTPTVKFLLGIANTGLLTLAALLNIKKPLP